MTRYRATIEYDADDEEHYAHVTGIITSVADIIDEDETYSD